MRFYTITRIKFESLQNFTAFYRTLQYTLENSFIVKF